jgi:hypothetical protein
MKVYLEGGPLHGAEKDFELADLAPAVVLRSIGHCFSGAWYKFTGRSFAGLRVFRFVGKQ